MKRRQFDTNTWQIRGGVMKRRRARVRAHTHNLLMRRRVVGSAREGKVVYLLYVNKENFVTFRTKINDINVIGGHLTLSYYYTIFFSF